jgi:hypothetical protein
MPTEVIEMTEEQTKKTERLQDAQHEQSSSFDKAILSLSSGGLVLSLAVVKDILDTAKLQYYGLLLTSWYCFGLSIISMIVSFKLAVHWIQKYLESDPQFGFYNRLTRWLNYLSIGAFAAGVIALLLFTTINISSRITVMENEQPKQQGTEEQRVQEGYDILPPDEKPKPEPPSPPPPQKDVPASPPSQ